MVASSSEGSERERGIVGSQKIIISNIYFRVKLTSTQGHYLFIEPLLWSASYLLNHTVPYGACMIPDTIMFLYLNNLYILAF
jgi:hypothetical protein